MQERWTQNLLQLSVLFLVTSNDFEKLIWGLQLGYLSSISGYGNMQPDYLAAFDFSSHLLEENLAQSSEQVSFGFWRETL